LRGGNLTCGKGGGGNGGKEWGGVENGGGGIRERVGWREGWGDEMWGLRIVGREITDRDRYVIWDCGDHG
jgi:hypothetical protein